MASKSTDKVIDEGRDTFTITVPVNVNKVKYGQPMQIHIPPHVISQAAGVKHFDALNLTGFNMTSTNTGANMYTASLYAGSPSDAGNVIETHERREDINPEAVLDLGHFSAHHKISGGVSSSKQYTTVPTADQIHTKTLSEHQVPRANHLVLKRFLTSDKPRMLSTGVKKVPDQSKLLVCEKSNDGVDSILHSIIKKGSEVQGEYYGIKPTTVGNDTGYLITKNQYEELKTSHKDFKGIKSPYANGMTLFINQPHEDLEHEVPEVERVDGAVKAGSLVNAAVASTLNKQLTLKPIVPVEIKFTRLPISTTTGYNLSHTTKSVTEPFRESHAQFLAFGKKIQPSETIVNAHPLEDFVDDEELVDPEFTDE